MAISRGFSTMPSSFTVQGRISVASAAAATCFDVPYS